VAVGKCHHSSETVDIRKLAIKLHSHNFVPTQQSFSHH